MPTRNAEAEWKGNLAQGSGRLKVGSGAFDGPYSFKSRFEEGQAATNPEELIGAAHAGCFTMALPRYGTADEIASLVAYLASPEAAFVTGASLSIDGGFTAYGTYCPQAGRPSISRQVGNGRGEIRWIRSPRIFRDSRAFTPPAPGSTRRRSKSVDAFNAVFGKQRPGVRANHAKGVDLQGVFRPSASASSMSKALHLQKASVPITVRFSNFGGNPTVSDADGLASPRGMSIRFRLPDGSDTDIVAHSYNGFPVATADELREFLLALAACGPGVAKPTPLDDFLGDHPITKTFLESQMPPPVSYGTVSYYGVNTFKFTNAQGTVTFGRYQIRPVDGDQSLPTAEVAKANPSYLTKETRQRVACGPVRFTLVLEVAEPGDKLDDPSIAWPPCRRKVELGTTEITQAVIDNADADRQLLFNPGGLPPGIEAEDPMIQARSAVYLASYDRRTQTE